MKIHYTGRNIEVTPALKTFTAEKIQRLEHRQYNIDKINIIFQIENVTHIAEANLFIDGIEINAKAEAKDMYTAIDQLVDKLVGQVTKHKTKQTEHR
jgi:putative sigma-54 modulation protein